MKIAEKRTKNIPLWQNNRKEYNLYQVGFKVNRPLISHHVAKLIGYHFYFVSIRYLVIRLLGY